jgi:phosphosulfolactate synthase (CoM biosynthesis protein A)
MTIGEVISAGAVTFSFSLLLAFVVDIWRKVNKVCETVAGLKRGDEDSIREIAEMKRECNRRHGNGKDALIIREAATMIP